MDKRQKLMMTGFVTMLLLLLLLMMMIMIMVTTQQAKYSGSSDVISLTNPVRS
jgi:ABC-type cobalt transport system substrate-binding protein